MIRLQLLGGPVVAGPDIEPDAATRLRRGIALLAVVAAAAPQPVGRERLLALLWPGSESERARNSLRQALFALRRDLGEGIFLEETPLGLQLDPAHIAVDLWEFEDAVRREAPADARAAYTGPFLEGFHLPELEEFSKWVESERTRIALKLDTVLGVPATPQDATAPALAKRGRPWVMPAVALGVIVALGGFYLSTRDVPPPSPIILGSGVDVKDGRDTQNRLVACEGPGCPASLPLDAFVVPKHAAYSTPAAGSEYIAFVVDGTTQESPGYACCTMATFERLFTLPPNAVTAMISVSVHADNQAIVRINGQEFGRQRDSLDQGNFSDLPETFRTTFIPARGEQNRLHVILWNGGGAAAIHYTAVVTYEIAADSSGRRPR